VVQFPGSTIVYTYDADSQMLSITNLRPDHVTVNSFDDYTYSVLGNVLTDTSEDGEWTYSYDADSQLIQAIFTPNSTDPDGLTPQYLQYVYDAAGNRISETVNGVMTKYVSNNINEYISSTINGVTTTFQYDANGNLIAQSVGGSTTTYTFNQLNQLTAASGPGLTASYGYDALGNRTSQTVNSVATRFEIDPVGLGNVVEEFTAGGALTAHFTYGLGLTSQVNESGTELYYDFNLLGSTIGVTNDSGAYVNEYAYDPFGQVTTIRATLTNQFTFVGQLGVSNDGSGFLNMRARQYNPETGQFTSIDPLGISAGSPNIREYALNSPATTVDPSGTRTLCGRVEKNVIKKKTAPKQPPPIQPPPTQPPSTQPPSNPWTEDSDEPNPKWKFGGYDSMSGRPLFYDPDNPDYLWERNNAGSWRYIYAPIGGIGVGDPGNSSGGASGGGTSCDCPPPQPPPPPGGSCTLAIGGTWYYICDNNPVTSGFAAIISIPGRDCTAQAVEAALGGLLGGGGGGGVPPDILGFSNCNPLLNLLGNQAGQAGKDAGDPPIDTTPAVTGTDQAADAAGANGNASPVAFITLALGNLGLINGQSGNSSNPSAVAAQMVSTIATFDQVESDLAGILATAAGPGGSLGIAGDIALLQQVDARLEAVTTAENLLFGGDANWLDTDQSATLQQWMTAFFTDVESSSDGSGTITPAEMTQLLATTLPSSVSTAEATEFLDRWNRTVQYWSEGIFTAAQVAAGQSTDFLDLGAIQTAFNAAVLAEQESEVAGYADVGTEVQGDLTQVQNDLAGQGTCATVTLQIGQTATLTRSAFSGTLSITNSEGTGAMTNVVMDITITDSAGNPANGEFYVSSPSYGGAFSVVNGVATLPDYSTGSISFTFIPDDSAASNGPTQYNIGGTIGFTDPSGGAVTIPVFPSTITVDPQPELQLNYFLQTDVIGPDPFTPQDVIPSEPATLGLLVTNVGGGTANNLSITTAQPQIVQNEKGLLVTFQIIGTQVGNQAVSPSLTVNLGALAPGQTADASFLLLSSLEGEFENFTATFSHSDALGGTATNLITSVVTHSLVHAGDFNYADSTGATDYLVDDNPNPEGLPDTIYFSDGTTAPVNIATNETSSAVGASSALTFQVTADVTSGWDYIQLPDPGAGYTLYKVVRSDGTVIPVSDQAWTTDRTISPSGASMVDNVLHIIDDNSTGSYLVYYRPTTATAPTVSSLSTVSSPQSGPVNSVAVTFSEPIEPSTFSTANLSLTLNGGANLINSSVTITQNSPTTFTIGGLSALTANDGNYALTVNATGISDFFGDTGTGSQSTSWATGTNVPVIVSVGATNPSLRDTPVETIDVVLSEPIVPGSFNYQALTLTLDGGPNLITSDVTVTEINATTYQIDGLATLTAIDGDYVLTVTASGLMDAAGHSGVGLLSESWVLNTVGPTVTSFPTYIQSPRNIVVPSIDVIFSEPIDPTTFTYQDITYSKAGGPNLITPSITITEISSTEFQISNFNNLIYPIDGTYTFTVSAVGVMDLAGNNGTGSLSTSWDLETTAPTTPTNLSISPDTGSSSTDGITDTGAITLSGALGEAGLMVDVYDSTTFLGSETVSGTTFQFPLNLASGTHDLLVTATDPAGNTSPASSYTVMIDLAPPTILPITQVSPDPRNTPVPSISVTFSEPIDLSTFTLQDLSLTLNGGPNLITSDVTVSLLSGSTYQISGLTPLTATDGTYVLTVNPQTIDDIAGNAGTTSVSTSWVMDTSTPSTPTNLAITPNTGVTPGLTDTGGVVLSGSLGAKGQTVDVFDATTNVDLGDATINGTRFSLDLSLAVGTHQLLITDISAAGNQSVPATFTIIVDETAPTATLAAIAGPRNTGVGSEEVTFSKPIIASTFTWQAISLTLNGGPNMITSAVTVSLVSGNTYQINGLSTLTSAEGTFILTLNEAEIEAQNGLTGTGSLSTSWLMDSTAPISQVLNTLGLSQTSDSFPVTVSFSDPAAADGGAASGVSSVTLYYSVNNGPFTLYQTATFAPTASGTYDFSFTGQDRNLYAFHSVAQDAAGNTESKAANAIDATTSVPDLNPPVTHVQSSSSYSNGVFTINWSGTDPDQKSGTPPGSIVTVDIYVEVDDDAPTLIAQAPGGTPNGSGVYSGTVTYNALADGQPHIYSFYSIGIDDQQKSQAVPPSPDVTFSNVTYTATLAAQPITVEKGIAGRSYIQYLDVDFNQTAATNSALQALASGLTGGTPSAYVELLWYGENLTTSSVPEGSVDLFGAETTATVALSGNDLSINFGPNGITSLLTENGVAGTGSPTKNFGDGWYALGIDPTGNPSNGQVFWETFYRLLGDANGTGVVTGPYTTPGTDAYNVYHAEGESGPLLSTDIDGNGVVNSKDFSETVLANGDAVGSVAPMNFPQFQLLAGAPAQTSAVAVTQAQVQTLLPLAIEAWAAEGLDAADIQKLKAVKVQVANLGTSILGLEAANTILINQNAAGQSWYLGVGTNAFALNGPGGESLAVADSPAAGRVDFLTVLEHELGHVLVLPDNSTPGDLMDITLGLGVSRSPSAADLVMLGQSQGISTTTSSAISASNGSTSTLQASLATPIDLRQGNASLTLSSSSLASLPAGPGSTTPGTAREIMYLSASGSGQTTSLSGGTVAQAIVDAALASLLGSVSGDDELPITQDVLPTQAVTPVQAIGVRTTAKSELPQSPALTTFRIVPSLAIRKNPRPTQSTLSGPGLSG
jgi:RHS repeat-associated protein